MSVCISLRTVLPVGVTKLRVAKLFRRSLHDGARDWMAARLLVSSFVFLVSCLAVLLFGGW